MELTLKEKLARGPVFGMTIYTGSVAIIETLGYWGFDFAFLDAEHVPMGIGPDMEKLVMAARLSGVSPLVRVTGCNEVEIRKSLEMGAEGVIIPHVRTRAEAELCVRAGRFPLQGRRGADATVRSARYATKGFDWNRYVEESNKNSMIIPMAEDFEYFDNIDDIMSVPGIDAINYGPTDYALSLGLKLFYKMDDPAIQGSLLRLTAKAKEKGMGVMAPAIPPTLENARRLISQGVNMVIMGSDMYNYQDAVKRISNEVIHAFNAND